MSADTPPPSPPATRWTPRRRRPDASAKAAAPRRGRRLAWYALSLLIGLVTLILLGIGGALWLVRSEPGTAWLLPHLPGIETRGARGALWGEFSAEQIVIALPDQGRLVLDDVAWRDVRVERTAAAGQWLRLYIGELRAARGELHSPRREGAASAPAPTDLQMPLELEIGRLAVGELEVPGLGEQPLRRLAAHLHLGAEGGTLHRIDGVVVMWDKLEATGAARIATRAPLALQADLSLAQQGSSDLPAWNATASLAGPLAEPVLQATLRAQPDATRPAQSLDARATLRPFAAWPLGDLQATARGLDLSAFHAAAPLTALDLDARATTRGLDQPASVALTAVNQAPGRWDEHRLPVRRARFELAARPDDLGSLEVQRLEAELGTERLPAGQLTGSGRWSAAGWNLEAALQALQPARLDARAPVMTLAGPLTARGAPHAPIELQAEIAGALAQRGPARAVRLRFDASVAPLRIELRSAQAQAGGARATLAGTLIRSALDAPWHAAGSAALVDFDPLPWWPGSATSPWRQGPHRITANGRFDLALPAATPTPTLASPARPVPLAEQLAALRGEADLRLLPSVLAGVSVSGSATLRSSAAGAFDASLALDAAGNQLRATGRFDPRGNGAADAWDLTLQAPVLARLAPVVRLLQPAGAALALAGAVDASAQVAGRWPALRTEGRFEASALRVGPAQAERAQGRWQLGSSADAPVDARISLERAVLAGQPLDSALLTLQGSARAHVLDLQAQAPGRPPAWIDGLQPAAPSPVGSAPAASVALLQAEGGLVDAAGTAAAGWRGKLRRIELRPATPGAAPWLRSAEVGIDLQWAGAPTRLRLDPGRAELPGAALRWSRIEWQAAATEGGAPRLEAQAELEPLRVAPLLARLQPDFGWGGDLSVAGRLDIRSADGLSADVVLERVAGDLSVTEEASTLALGLTELRLGLSARNGVWTITPRVVGTRLGEVSGSVVANADRAALWPGPQAPVRGAITAEVADLATLGNWLPPGWRVAGRVRADATIAGRFGAPEYTGQVVGSQIAVRNFLDGVSISDGDVAIALQGSNARIERFSARAGNGSLRVEGGASLGAAPKADLNLIAERFQLLGRVDRKIVISGRGRLQLDRETVRLDGRYDIDEGLIDFSRSDAPSLADDVVVRRGTRVVDTAPAEPISASPARPPAPGARKVALDLRLGLGRNLRLRGRGIDTLLQGELHATAPGGRFALAGTVQTAEGTYAAYGQKLAIDRGNISFNGPIENPRLDIEATRPNLDIRVGVAIGGSALNPRVRLFSEPSMSDVDKLSWLVLGRASEGLGRTETALLQRAALALLAGEGPGMTDQFTKAIGLDELSVRQSDGEVRETVVSLGKQLSRRWYVGYERSLSATAGTWQLIYRIAQRFTLRAQSGLDNSVDLIWTWRWQ